MFTEQLAQSGVPLIFGGVVLGGNMILDSMCKRSGEFIDHLGLHCEIENAFWNIQASKSTRAFLYLEKARWQLANCNSVKDGPYIPYLVHMG